MLATVKLVVTMAIHCGVACYQNSILSYQSTDTYGKMSFHSTSFTLKTHSRIECAIMKMMYNVKGFGYNRGLNACHLHWRCLTKYDTSLVEEPGWENYCEQFYAFHAQASKTTSGIMRFERVTLNTGNAFDQSTGFFTCKREGVYIFVMSACTQSDLNLGIWTAREGKVNSWNDVDAHYQDTSTMHFGSGIARVIRELERGDTVYAELKSGQQLGNFTTFSGWILSDQNETVFAMNFKSGHTPKGNYKYSYADESLKGKIDKASGVFTTGDGGLYLFLSSAKSKITETGLQLMIGNTEGVTIAAKGQLVVVYEMKNQSTAHLYFDEDNFVKSGLRFSAFRISTGIGFTVKMSDGLHTNDIFDIKITDPYGLYNSGFNVKHNGLYFISWTAMTEKKRFMTSYLTVNDERREDCYSYNDDLAHTSTCFILLQLNEGDHVNISRQDGSYSWNGKYMSFSGILLSVNAK